MDDHLVIPEFPPDKTEYDDFVKDYICNINLTPLPVNQPLWQLHLVNYNTSKARATLILNLHHSLGDGTSLMSLCLSCATRADDSNLPLTFPSSKSLPTKVPLSLLSIKFMYSMLQRLFELVLALWYIVSDFTHNILRTSMLLNDSKLSIRGPPRVLEMLPKVMSHVTFQMEDIKKIKNSLSGIVNDVIMGVIFYDFHRYLQLTHFYRGNGKEMRKSRVIGLVTINTTALSGFKDTKDMMKPENRIPWGNHVGFLHVPMLTANGGSPLDYVRGAKEIMDKKKMSREVHLTCRLINYIGCEEYFCIS